MMTLCMKCYTRLQPWETRDMLCTRCKEQQRLHQYIEIDIAPDQGAEVQK